MSSQRRTCWNPKCLQETRTVGPYCPYCQAPLDHDEFVIWQKKQEKKAILKKIAEKVKNLRKRFIEMKKIIIFAALIVVALILFGVFSGLITGLNAPWGTLSGIAFLAIIVGLVFGLIGSVLGNKKEQTSNIKPAIIVCGIGLACLIVFICIGSFIPAQKTSVTGTTAIATVESASAANPAATTSSTAPTASASSEVFSLGKPASPEDVDPEIWNKPQDKAVMVDANGTTVYTQSGKNGSVLLKGQIPDGQVLVLDSYSLTKVVNDKTESYSGGNLLVIVGPVDLDKNPISYTNGAAQTIGLTNLQNFLDQNVWVKFSRGDRLKDNSAWSYKAWALQNIFLPDGYTFQKLGLTAATDNYPNK